MVRWLERRTVELGTSTQVGRGGSVVRAPDCRVRRHTCRWGAVVRWLERRTVNREEFVSIYVLCHGFQIILQCSNWLLIRDMYETLTTDAPGKSYKKALNVC